jgi:hypothetical protein
MIFVGLIIIIISYYSGATEGNPMDHPTRYLPLVVTVPLQGISKYRPSSPNHSVYTSTGSDKFRSCWLT